LTTDPIIIVIDSGSDITLISRKVLNLLSNPPKIKQGHNVNLIQVTGTSSISGYVNLDLFFQTEDGPVKLNVDAYVVDEMMTPFILGNDFADQYSISILREEGNTHLQFGDSGRRLRVENSTSPSLVDEAGHAFEVKCARVRAKKDAKQANHRRNQRIRRRSRRKVRDGRVSSTERVVIPAKTSRLVKVETHFPKDCEQLLVEKYLKSCGNIDDVYGHADTFISKDNSALHISNFSDFPVIISEGQVLGTAHNPRNWLDKASKMSPARRARAEAHANFIRQLVEIQSPTEAADVNVIRSESNISSKAHRNATGEDDPASEEPVEGGPKTAESPPESVESSKLLSELDFSKDLTPEQRKALEEVCTKNAKAFGLDGRLGTYKEQVVIPMKPGAEPVSLPQFPASPAKQEVIDKQMNSWIELGVIEPSRSPWAAPVFTVWRNGKPRMVIDLRKLNELVVPDEFPLARQEDVLQALEGSQWLTTLDALAGFTQLTMHPDSAEKLAFRSHRGLWQFARMPFGYRNGPSIFQRVMNTVLAPFLWIFALVYIDDIVIYSRTFEDHVNHLDAVLGAIAKANLTLSPPKCHVGYQSLMLLGQKVSRLGLSTHKEKVDAIVQLEEPRNVSELQTFLGMMVYFSSYVPFYAWIAQPLFDLLKKGVAWNWTDLQKEAFQLCKEVLSNAPVRGYSIRGLPYRVYSDACDYGVAGILQQVQPIKIRDLRGTKIYERLEKAFQAKDPIPQLPPILWLRPENTSDHAYRCLPPNYRLTDLILGLYDR
jgi:hypothetical protein